MREVIKWIELEDISLHTYVWSSDVVETKGLFLLIHGSVEHSARYREFAEQLTQNGYTVVAPDLRGHGKTGEKSGSVGHFSDGPMGWELCVHDIKYVYDRCRMWFPKMPVVLFGHSMGSFLVRSFLKEYPVSLKAGIISGTGDFERGLGDVGIWLAKGIMRMYGPRHKSPLLTDMVFNTLNRKVGKTETPFDFLSRDADRVQLYLADPLCGYTCTAEYIHEMLLGSRKSNDYRLFELSPSTLPMLFISGDADPLGGRRGSGVKNVVHRYRQHMTDVTFKLYKNARHELLNELNREMVIADVLDWLSSIS